MYRLLLIFDNTAQHTLIHYKQQCLRTGCPTAPSNHALARNPFPTDIGSDTMPKEIKNKREDKKKATLTPKEKKAAKRSKKESKLVKSA